MYVYTYIGKHTRTHPLASGVVEWGVVWQPVTCFGSGLNPVKGPKDPKRRRFTVKVQGFRVLGFRVLGLIGFRLLVFRVLGL